MRSLLVLRKFSGPNLQGPCPECGTEATTYFGDIFTVKGPRVDNTVTCSNCKASINMNAEKRSVNYFLICFLLLVQRHSLHTCSVVAGGNGVDGVQMIISGMPGGKDDSKKKEAPKKASPKAKGQQASPA